MILNIYDLSPANDCLYPVGFGLHHSGVEINGVEYSFASGAGIFESDPKEAAGAKYRESIELGAFEGGSSELRMVVADLRSDFGPDSYNLLTKNCNHFAAALVWSLLRRPIPSYVNRLAYVGSCFSCLLPSRMLGNAPVGSNAGYGDAIKVSGGGGRNLSSQPLFTGTSHKLGGSSTSTTSSSSSSSSTTKSNPISSVMTSTVRPPSSNTDDLTDRREKARLAAMARIEKQQEMKADTSKNV